MQRRFAIALAICATFATYANAQKWIWGWVADNQKQFTLESRGFKAIWQAPEPVVDKDAASLVRITITSSFPVNAGFVDAGAIGDPAAFQSSDASVCSHTGITKLKATCSISRDDTRRTLVIQDANQAFLTAGVNAAHASNQVQVTLENYACTNCAKQ